MPCDKILDVYAKVFDSSFDLNIVANAQESELSQGLIKENLYNFVSSNSFYAHQCVNYNFVSSNSFHAHQCVNVV
jgi:hypothetical protein